MYTGKLRIPTNRFCSRCDSRIYHSDVKGYPYVCRSCDENMFKCETYKKKDKDTYINPIAYAIQNRAQKKEMKAINRLESILYNAVCSWYDDSLVEYHGLDDEAFIKRVCDVTGLTEAEYQDLISGNISKCY